MPHAVRGLVWCFTVVLCVLSAGCSDPDRATPPATSAGAGGSSPVDSAGKDQSPPSTGDRQSGTAEPAKGDSGSGSTTGQNSSPPADPANASAVNELLELTLAEIDARANWIDQPVVNLLAKRREEESQTRPPVTAEQALGLRNTSREINDQIVATLGRVAQSTDEIDYEATLTRHIKADAKSTSPLFASSVYETDVQGLIGLIPFTFDRNMDRYGDADVIVSWQTSSDRLMDKITLRDDLVWSDGHPITAHDLEFSFQTIMSPGISIPAIKTALSRLAGVKAFDDHTVVYFHKEALNSRSEFGDISHAAAV